MADETHSQPATTAPPATTGRMGPTDILPDRFEVIEEVGRGGMGAVFKARHRQLDKLVALKVILPGASAERFQREAKLLARVASPHVVAVHDFEPRAGSFPVLVMEWVDGSDLGRTLRQSSGPLPESRVLPWMRQVAEGMRAAADHGVIHRDLKPSNVLLDARDQARVCDFGLARGPAEGADLTRSDGLMGTPYYMAPEQAESPRAADTRADIYSFGATFYHVLTGSVPFDGESAFSILFKHKVEPLVAPQARNPSLSDRLAGVLERCLAKNPADRFQSFAELLKYLQPAQEPAAQPWDEDDDRLRPYWDRYSDRRLVYLLNRSALDPADVYTFPDGRTLTIAAGSITAARADAIVSSDDDYLTMGGGVSEAIRHAAGGHFRADAQRYTPVRQGRVIVTPAGKLAARFVFHAVTLAFTDPDQATHGATKVLWPTRDLIRELLHACVYHADSLYVRSLALPLLGTGAGGLDADVCLDTLFQFWARTLLRGVTFLRDVRIVLYHLV